MNERIEKLYKEATGKSFANDFDARVLEAEKFAELIVKECADLLESMIKNATFTEDEEFDSGWVLGVEDSVSELNKHFGVK